MYLTIYFYDYHMYMKNYNTSKILSIAMLATNIFLWTSCTKISTEEQKQIAIQNIRIHTIRWYFEHKCIGILDAEASSISVIMSNTDDYLPKQYKDSLMIEVQNNVYGSIRQIINWKRMPGKNCLEKTDIWGVSLWKVIGDAKTLTQIQKTDLLSMAGLKE